MDETRMSDSFHEENRICPACGKLLEFTPNPPSGHAWHCWCPFDRCQSVVSNSGALGQTKQEAFDGLKAFIEEEGTLPLE